MNKIFRFFINEVESHKKQVQNENLSKSLFVKVLIYILKLYERDVRNTRKKIKSLTCLQKENKIPPAYLVPGCLFLWLRFVLNKAIIIQPWNCEYIKT